MDHLQRNSVGRPTVRSMIVALAAIVAFHSGAAPAAHAQSSSSGPPELEAVRRDVHALLDQRRPLADGRARESLITYVEDRLGHDRRYAISCLHTMRELDWAPQLSLDQGLAAAAEWTLAHPDFWAT